MFGIAHPVKRWGSNGDVSTRISCNLRITEQTKRKCDGKKKTCHTFFYFFVNLAGCLLSCFVVKTINDMSRHVVWCGSCRKKMWHRKYKNTNLYLYFCSKSWAEHRLHVFRRVDIEIDKLTHSFVAGIHFSVIEISLQLQIYFKSKPGNMSV